MPTIFGVRTLIARALVRLAVVAAPADMAGRLINVLGGGGPRPIPPQQ